MTDELTEDVTPAIPETPVHSTPEIPETPAGAILDQANDPVFIALQREKKRTRRLRKLLTANKNLGTVSTDSTTSPGSDPVAGPDVEGRPAPVLETGNKKGKRDPISGALNFLGRGNKKRDGP